MNPQLSDMLLAMLAKSPVISGSLPKAAFKTRLSWAAGAERGPKVGLAGLTC
jgi:hypothetical protein